jgi:hypothetical protein
MTAFDKKEVLEALKIELSILEGGGYGRSVRTPWHETTLFRDSVSCLNVGEKEKVHACAECFLIAHVPDRWKETDIPCHYIPLNEKGETIAELDGKGDRENTEKALAEWLRATIARLERELGQTGSPPPAGK